MVAPAAQGPFPPYDPILSNGIAPLGYPGPMLGHARMLCPGLTRNQRKETIRLKETILFHASLQQEEHDKLKEDYRSIARHMGLVTRLVSSGSKEISDSPAALRSIVEQYEQMETLDVLRI